jgi:hypothetical protein
MGAIIRKTESEERKAALYQEAEGCWMMSLAERGARWADQLWGGIAQALQTTPRSILPYWACYIEHGHSSEGCWHLLPR